MKLYGLLGHPLKHSKSKELFDNRFGTDDSLSFELFDYSDSGDFLDTITKNPSIQGFNVTIPHKRSVVSWLSEQTDEVVKTGACNAVKVIRESNKTIFHGHNTDVTGFKNSLPISAMKNIEQCIILGTGGAAKSVEFVLSQFNLDIIVVSRSPSTIQGTIGYKDISTLLKNNTLVVNCTPVGMFPGNETINFPYDMVDESFVFYDLVYNPLITGFMASASKMGATVMNGRQMLELQAQESWKFWGLI
jgi:shikimate dehydrogenase